MTVLSGYALMLDNLGKANATSVVFPAADEGMTHLADLGEHAPTEISGKLTVAAADKVEVHSTKNIPLAEGVKLAATSKPVPLPTKGIQPIKGSESILLSNLINRQLSGCKTFGVIELHHTGSDEDALIVLRNETYRMNGNLLLPIKASKTASNGAGSNEIKIEAQMMRCPSKLARGK